MKHQIRQTGQTADEASNALSVALNNWFTEFGPVPIFKSCANCAHMVNDNQTPTYCNKYNMTPPVAVVVAGCPAHVDSEEIPF